MADMNKPAQDSPLPPAPHSGQTPTLPLLDKRMTPGSSGFQIGYWCRIERTDDGQSLRCNYIPDPKGESWIIVAELPGMGKVHELLAQAEFIVTACNAHASLLARNAALEQALKRMEQLASSEGWNTVIFKSYFGEAVREARKAIAGNVSALTPSTLTAQSTAQAGTKEAT